MLHIRELSKGRLVKTCLRKMGLRTLSGFAKAVPSGLLLAGCLHRVRIGLGFCCIGFCVPWGIPLAIPSSIPLNHPLMFVLILP